MAKKQAKRDHKPIIETMINTSALALTATGTAWILDHDLTGFILVIAGAALEFYKYWGRNRNYW